MGGGAYKVVYYLHLPQPPCRGTMTPCRGDPWRHHCRQGTFGHTPTLNTAFPGQGSAFWGLETNALAYTFKDGSWQI